MTKLLTPSMLSPHQKQACRDILKKKVMCITSDCGFGKCQKVGTKLIMFDGSIREIQNIHVGDLLLGDDNRPRRVTSRHDGNSELFKITPTKGEPWSCNINHKLCTLSSTRNSLGKAHEYHDIEMSDYLKLSKTSQNTLVQYMTGFNGWNNDTEYRYDPYFIGLWLGNGDTRTTGITNSEPEILEYIKQFAKGNMIGLREEYIEGKSPKFFVTNGVGGKNPVWSYIKRNLHNENGDKHLPDRMITVNRSQRLSLLAGLLDTDGYYINCGFEIVQKHLHLADSICKLSRSLGFFVTRTVKVVKGVNYYRLYITGDIDKIPTIVPRKKAEPRTINKDHRRTNFTVESEGNGDWVGLTVNGNHRYLMHDFTVCHNSIVGLTTYKMIKKKQPNVKALVVCTPEGIKKTWSNEHLKWSHTKNLRVKPLVGTPAKRLKILKQDGDIYAISYNSLKWLVDNNKGRHKVNFDFVFADEGDCLKGHASKWRSELIKCAPNVRYKVISSATPKTAEEDDYWGLCMYLDGGKSLLAENITMFRAIYMSSFVFNHRQIYKIKPGMVETLESRIKHLFINYEMSDKATIPIKTRTMTIELSPSARKKYDTLQDTQCINSVVFNEHGVKDLQKSLDAMVLSGKLSQLTNGFLYVDENLRITPEMLAATTDIKSLIKKSKKKVAVNVFNDRLKGMRRLVKKIYKIHGKQPIVMPYLYKHDLVQLRRLFPNALCDTDKDFQNIWNKGKTPFLLLQYTRSSKSLNLQHGGHIMAFYSPTFKWVDDYQIIRRLARQGQKHECVYAYRLYIKDTIDDIKTKRLDQRFKGHSRFQTKILASIH